MIFILFDIGKLRNIYVSITLRDSFLVISLLKTGCQSNGFEFF